MQDVFLELIAPFQSVYHLEHLYFDPNIAISSFPFLTTFYPIYCSILFSIFTLFMVLCFRSCVTVASLLVVP